MNKIAYAHHNDDAVETFLMSLLYSGQLTTFTPVTYLDRTGLKVIRPLIYFRESETRAAVRYHGFTPVPSPCPHDGHTIRQEVKEPSRGSRPRFPISTSTSPPACARARLGELLARNQDARRDEGDVSALIWEKRAAALTDANTESFS